MATYDIRPLQLRILKPAAPEVTAEPTAAPEATAEPTEAPEVTAEPTAAP